jgi:hypothetical protein
LTDRPTFGAALTCIDGRITDVVVDGLRRAWGVDHVDLVTSPGPETARSLRHDSPVWPALQISVERHGAHAAAVIAHTDCAANDVDDDQRRQQVRDAVAAARAELPGTSVTGWLVHTDEQYMEEVR